MHFAGTSSARLLRRTTCKGHKPVHAGLMQLHLGPHSFPSTGNVPLSISHEATRASVAVVKPRCGCLNSPGNCVVAPAFVSRYQEAVLGALDACSVVGRCLMGATNLSQASSLGANWNGWVCRSKQLLLPMHVKLSLEPKNYFRLKELQQLFFSVKGMPSTPANSDFHPCTGPLLGGHAWSTPAQPTPWVLQPIN